MQFLRFKKEVAQSDLTTIDLEANVTAPEPTMDEFDVETAKIEAALKEATRLLPPQSPPSAGPDVPLPAALPRSTLTLVDDQVAFARAGIKRLVEQNRLLRGKGPATTRIRATRVSKLATDMSDAVGRLERARDSERAAAASRLYADVIRAVNASTSSSVTVSTSTASASSPRSTIITMDDDAAAAAVDAAPGGDNANASAQALLRRLVPDDLRDGFDDELLAAPELRAQRETLMMRNDELRRLANSVADLRELFLDLGLYVMEQQGIINETEANLEGTKKHHEQTADVELVQAVAYKRRVRRRKMYIGVAVLVLLAVVVLVVLLMLR